MRKSEKKLKTEEEGEKKKNYKLQKKKPVIFFNFFIMNHMHSYDGNGIDARGHAKKIIIILNFG